VEHEAVELKQSEPIFFPEGLVGCADWRSFVLVAVSDDEPVCLLQSTDEPEIALLVTDPRLIDPTYACPLSPADRAALRLAADDEPLLLCTLTLRREPASITANLVGPIVVNLRERVGKQLVLADTTYSARHLVLLGQGGEPALARGAG
jgi:flagellar assembly factor FliW